MTNIKKGKIDQIIDFDVLEEILNYCFQENIVRIKRVPNSPTKRTPLDITFLSPENTILTEMGIRRNLKR